MRAIFLAILLVPLAVADPTYTVAGDGACDSLLAGPCGAHAEGVLMLADCQPLLCTVSAVARASAFGSAPGDHVLRLVMRVDSPPQAFEVTLCRVREVTLTGFDGACDGTTNVAFRLDNGACIPIALAAEYFTDGTRALGLASVGVEAADAHVNAQLCHVSDDVGTLTLT